MSANDDTFPIMANIIPWNEAILRGDRTFKTLHFRWTYRGPVLLYNSKSAPDEDAAHAYGINPDTQPRGVIVGFAHVIDCDKGAGRFLVLLARPQRFVTPIPFIWPNGAIRIARGPAAFLAEEVH